MWHDNGRYGFAPLRIGYTAYCNILHFRMDTDDTFSFRWIDVLTTTDDHVALSINEIDVAVGITAGHVANRALSSIKEMLNKL